MSPAAVAAGHGAAEPDKLELSKRDYKVYCLKQNKLSAAVTELQSRCDELRVVGRYGHAEPQMLVQQHVAICVFWW